MSYEITETCSIIVNSSFGMLTQSEENRSRQLDIDLRVGDYALDNTHPIRGGLPGMDFLERFSQIEIPIGDAAAAIRSILWWHTDKTYKRALEQLTKVRTNVQARVGEEDKSADLSQEPFEKYLETPGTLTVDRRQWEEKAGRYTWWR